MKKLLRYLLGIAVLTIGGLYLSGFLVSLDLTYDKEVELAKTPKEELREMKGYLQLMVDRVLGEYSIPALLEYTKTTNPNATDNFTMAMDYYRSSYGHVEECPDRSPVYIEQLSLFSETQYFWRWSSDCTFEKSDGTVIFDFSKTSEGWVLKNFGIQKL